MNKSDKQKIDELTELLDSWKEPEKQGIFDGSKGCWRWDFYGDEPHFSKPAFSVLNFTKQLVESGQGHETEQQCEDQHKLDLLIEPDKDICKLLMQKSIGGYWDEIDIEDAQIQLARLYSRCFSKDVPVETEETNNE